MKTRLVLTLTAALLLTAATGRAEDACCAAKTAATSAEQAPVTPLQNILNHLQQNAAELTTCTARLNYLVIQDPDLLDSHAVRKGTLHYLKTDGRSQVKIQFDTLRQDDFDEEERLEIYLFDGVWLTKIDYALEQVDMYQQAREDEPINAFDFLSHHFPLVGFSGSKDFDKDFDVRLAEPAEKEEALSHLVLDVKKDSRYSKDYKTIDFWIDNESYLPRRVKTLSTQGDIYDIEFLDIQTNKKVEKEIFIVKTPDHFRMNKEILEDEQPQPKGEN